MEGFGGTRRVPRDITIPTEASEAMQQAALSQITAKAGPRLPVVRGRDPDLPKSAPVFDLDTMRKRNIESIKKRVLKEPSDA